MQDGSVYSEAELARQRAFAALMEIEDELTEQWINPVILRMESFLVTIKSNTLHALRNAAGSLIEQLVIPVDEIKELRTTLRHFKTREKDALSNQYDRRDSLCGLLVDAWVQAGKLLGIASAWRKELLTAPNAGLFAASPWERAVGESQLVGKAWRHARLGDLSEKTTRCIVELAKALEIRDRFDTLIP